MEENGNQRLLIYFSKFSEVFSNSLAMIMQTYTTKFNSMYIKSIGSRDIPVCIANNLHTDRPETGGSTLGRARDFSLLSAFQTISGTHLASYPMVTRRKKGISMKLPAYLHSVPRLMCGDMTPFPHTSSWHSA
jgi:hypothetical protein